jgi:hypothetical protein
MGPVGLALRRTAADTPELPAFGGESAAAPEALAALRGPGLAALIALLLLRAELRLAHILPGSMPETRADLPVAEGSAPGAPFLLDPVPSPALLNPSSGAAIEEADSMAHD